LDITFYSKLKDFKGKLSTHWLGPYEIDIVFYNGSVKSNTIDVEGIYFMVNGHQMRLYHKQISREEFVLDLIKKYEMEVVRKRGVSPTSTST